MEKEALSVIYGLKVNRALILGYEVEVRSDHRPLVWLLKAKSPNSRIARWQALLSEYTFSVKHIAGKDNTIADLLSRMQRQESDMLEEEIDRRIMMVSRRRTSNDENKAVGSKSEMNLWNLEDLIDKQNKDEEISELKRLVADVKKGVKVTFNKKFMKYPLDNLDIDEGVLFCMRTDEYGKSYRCAVIPSDYISTAIALGHSVTPAGHGGTSATLAKCRRFAFWIGMKADVKRYCEACPVCLKFRVKKKLPAPLQRYPEVSAPLERIHIDLVGPLTVTEEGYKYIFTAIDVMSRFAITAPIRSKEASEVAKAFHDHVLCVHGAPDTLVSDNGKEFLNKMFESLTDITGIVHLKITPWHPGANGVVEKMHANLINILKSICQDNRSNWSKWLPSATHAYNTAFHRVIKDTPYFLMFLRDAKVPFETLEKEIPPLYNPEDYKREVLKTSKLIYETCQYFLEEGRLENERKNPRSKKLNVEVGDRVYLRNIPKVGEPKKLQPLYEGPYRVIKKISDVVIRVQRIKGGPIKSIHTDNVRLIPEQNLTIKEVPSIRSAYPWNIKSKHSQDNEYYDEPIIQDNALDEEQERQEETSAIPETMTQNSAQNNVGIHDSIPGNNIHNDNITTDDSNNTEDLVVSHPPPRRALRSNTIAPDMPHVMERPLEYQRS